MSFKKVLFIGGIKSGKSRLAEEYILKHSNVKPIYFATNEFFDDEMHHKVQLHQKQRGDKFITIEEPLLLSKKLLSTKQPVLVECISTWINNMIYHKYSQEEIYAQVKELKDLKQDVVFVISEVGQSVVSEHKLVREFVNINGKVAQFLALLCDEVYSVQAGIALKLK